MRHPDVRAICRGFQQPDRRQQSAAGVPATQLSTSAPSTQLSSPAARQAPTPQAVAVIGAVVPYLFFFQFFGQAGVDLPAFIGALFVNGAAGGFKNFVNDLRLGHAHTPAVPHDGRALDAAGVDKLDLVFMDTCLMGQLEVAVELADVAGAVPQAGPVWGEGPPAPGHPQRIGASFRRLCRAHERVLVEGIGGWLVPIDERRTVRDLARQIDAYDVSPESIRLAETSRP